MAKKANTVNAAEETLSKKIEAFRKAHPKMTDKQKEELSEMRSELGQLRFVRIANLRVPKAIGAVSGIGNLSGAGYHSTEAQQKAIVKALREAVSAVETKLSGKKETSGGFVLPAADENGAE